MGRSETQGTLSSFPDFPEKRWWPRTWRSVVQPIASAAHQAWHDLRTARWAVFGVCVLYMALLGAVIFGLVALPVFANPFGFGTGCDPDGKFSVYADRFNWWAPSGFFQITVSLGVLNFTQVKVLDIAWQVVAGRGGQALIAFLLWSVFAEYVATKMIEAPVTYATYWVLFLHQEPTITSTYRLARDFCFYTGTRSPVMSIFVIVTTIFALAYPTFVNSMSGYVTDNSPYIEVETGTMVPLFNFTKLAYVIHDGDRVGLSKEYNVLDMTRDPLIYDYNWYFNSDCVHNNGKARDCAILGAVSNYVSQYGFNGLEDRETLWMGKPTEGYFLNKDVDVDLNRTTLPAPALNIEGFYFQDHGEEGLFGYNWKDLETGDYPFQNLDKQMYVYNGKRYSLADIQSLGDCKPKSSQEYQWGVSFIQLFIMMTALTVWSTGLYIMWHKARHRLPLKNEPEVPRGWRAMAELSRTIERDLGSRGIDIATMEDWQVKREIRKQLRGGAISLDARLANSTYRTWPAFLTWVRKEKWWVLAWLCIIATSMLPFFLGGIHTCIVLWTVGGLFWAVVWLGNTGGSRAFMLAVAALVSITISTAVWGT